MILDEILEHKRQEVQERKSRLPVAELIARAQDQSAARDFRASITRDNGGIRLIAEMKKASPSAGLIRDDFSPDELAAECEEAGAAAISVLTDERFFQGHLDYLEAVKKGVKVPVLRKDFVIDDYQVFESRAAGADALLLIARALTVPDLERLRELASELGMSALVEVHSEHEVGMALSAGADIVGINNRDLETFHVDLETTVRLHELLGEEKTVVSESGISDRSDVKLLERLGVDAVLVGEIIMRDRNVGAKVRELLGDPGEDMRNHQR
jgi:indole-3-glycerol phosphate synthase